MQIFFNTIYIMAALVWFYEFVSYVFYKQEKNKLTVALAFLISTVFCIDLLIK